MTTVSTTSKAPTYSQRSSAAAAQANERFGFADEKRMLAALGEMAVDEMSRNPAFAVRVRNRYEELAPQKPPTRAKAVKTAKPKLIPIKELPGFQLDATRRVDPWFILEYFGAKQLEPALRMQTIGNLREAIAVVEERYPGTAPKGKLTKDSAVSYILQQVLG